jgi:hypothetical protein
MLSATYLFLGIILKQLLMFTLVSHNILAIHFKNYVAGSQRRKCDPIFGREIYSKDKNYKKIDEIIILKCILRSSYFL